MANGGWMGLIIFGWWFSCLHSQMAQELPELKNSTHVLRAEKRKLREEQIALQETCEEVKRLLKEVRETVCDPCAEKHQVG